MSDRLQFVVDQLTWTALTIGDKLKFVGHSTNQLPNFLHHDPLALLFADGDEDGIFARQRPDDFRDGCIVNFYGDGRSPAGKTLSDHQHVAGNVETLAGED